MEDLIPHGAAQAFADPDEITAAAADAARAALSDLRTSNVVYQS